MHLGELWIDLQSPSELAFGGDVLVHLRVHDAEPHAGFGVVRIDLERLPQRCQRIAGAVAGDELHAELLQFERVGRVRNQRVDLLSGSLSREKNTKCDADPVT